MMRLFFVASVFVATTVVSLPPRAAGDSILTCTFSVGTASFYEGVLAEKSIAATLDRKEGPWSIVFTGLDTNRPRMKGNMGEQDLLVLRRTPTTVWLGEVPPLGGLNVWTIFSEHKTAVLSKQYELLGGPLGVLSMGKCR